MVGNIPAVKLMTVPEAAAALSVSPKTLWAWIYSRKIGSTLIGRSRRIPVQAVHDLVERGMVPAREVAA
jgi:excisionase family DNA binding protein